MMLLLVDIKQEYDLLLLVGIKQEYDLLLLVGIIQEYDLSLQYHSTNISILIFFYILLLLDGQMGKAWEPSKKQCSCGN